MFNFLKWRFVMAALELLVSQIDPQDAKEIFDDLIDRVEDRNTNNPVVMKLCQKVRDTFDIPDDIGGDED